MSDTRDCAECPFNREYFDLQFSTIRESVDSLAKSQKDILATVTEHEKFKNRIEGGYGLWKLVAGTSLIGTLGILFTIISYLEK